MSVWSGARREAEKLADHPQDVTDTLPRRDIQLDLRGEDEQPNPVVALGGCKGQHRTHLRRQLVLQPSDRAEPPGGAEVNGPA